MSDRAWHATTVAEVEMLLETCPDGLAGDEPATRLRRFGPNELDEVPPPSRLVTFVGQFRSPLIYILLGAAIVTAALSEWIDAIVIAAVLLINAIIGFTQERRAGQRRCVRSASWCRPRPASSVAATGANFPRVNWSPGIWCWSRPACVCLPISASSTRWGFRWTSRC